MVLKTFKVKEIVDMLRNVTPQQTVLRVGPAAVSVGSAGQPTLVKAPIRRAGVYMSVLESRH